MTQMRKFEQEAIADEILDTIKTESVKQQNKMERNIKELKDMLKINAKMKSLAQQEKQLYREKSALDRELRDMVDDFNVWLGSDKVYSLEKGYNDGIEWKINDWQVKQEIERKLAIALLSSDWQERLPEIIESIASQFKTI